MLIDDFMGWQGVTNAAQVFIKEVRLHHFVGAYGKGVFMKGKTFPISI